MRLIAAALLVLAAAAPAAAQDAPPHPPYPIASWAKLAHEEREATIVAAIEGLLLAATGPEAGAPHVSQDCLAAVSVETAEKAMLDDARRSPGRPFVQSFLGATQCSHS